MLIGLPIAILYFLARKITAEGAEERKAFNHLSPPPRPSAHSAVNRYNQKNNQKKSKSLNDAHDYFYE